LRFLFVAKVSVVLFFGLLLRAAACPFCNPGESDIFSDIEGAQAVVLVEKIDTRKYKVLEILSGQVKLGRIVVAAEPDGKLGKKGHLLLTTAGPPNLPYWSDSPRVLTDQELRFAREVLKISKEPTKTQLDFAARHLQNPSSIISSAAYNLLAGASLKDVQDRAELVGQTKLVEWVQNPKIPPERRALYLLMSYRSMLPSESVWLEKELFNPALSPSSALLGPLAVAYLHLNGAPAIAKLESTFYAPKLPASRITPINRALTLVGEQTQEADLKRAIQKLFRKEVLHPQRGAFVLAPLAIWQDQSASAQIEELFQKNKDVTWVKVAVIRYFRSFQTPAAGQAIGRLSKLDPNLVRRTTDGYRRSDLGID
jgi:hypothetical protein